MQSLIQILLTITALFAVANACYQGVSFYRGSQIGEPEKMQFPFQCQQKCVKHPACVGFTWTSKGHPLRNDGKRLLCHLFSQTAGVERKEFSISGPKFCPRGDCALNNINFLSLNLGTFERVDSPDPLDCYRKCQAKTPSECVAWSWVKKSIWSSFTNSRCYMRRNIESVTSRETVGMSGARKCDPTFSISNGWRPVMIN